MCACAHMCSEERQSKVGTDPRERERRNKNTIVRSPIGSVVPRHIRCTRIFFFIFPTDERGTYIRRRWWPCARWSRILSQGQSVSQIHLSFVLFLFHHRARRDTAAKKHWYIFPPNATMNCLRFFETVRLDGTKRFVEIILLVTKGKKIAIILTFPSSFSL